MKRVALTIHGIPEFRYGAARESRARLARAHAALGADCIEPCCWTLIAMDNGERRELWFDRKRDGYKKPEELIDPLILYERMPGKVGFEVRPKAGNWFCTLPPFRWVVWFSACEVYEPKTQPELDAARAKREDKKRTAAAAAERAAAPLFFAGATRVPRAQVEHVVRHLSQLWNLEPVGSFRRMRADVGDLEFIAPHVEPREASLMEAGVPDVLFDAISAQLGTSWCRLVKGLSPGFRYCQLVVTQTNPVRREIGVDIFRYSPGNRGWIELMRTGPKEFGQALLSRWKSKMSIPHHIKGSVDGWLVEPIPGTTEYPSGRQVEELGTDPRLDWKGEAGDMAAGVRVVNGTRAREIVYPMRPVVTPTEDSVFALVGLKYIKPEDRDEFLANQQAGARRDRQEVWR